LGFLSRMRRMIAFEFKRFNNKANLTTFPEIKKYLFDCLRIILIPKEKIVKLDIPWGELYCTCNEEEWSELYKILNKNNVVIKKWTILNYIVGIRKPLLLFIIYLLIVISIMILYLNR